MNDLYLHPEHLKNNFSVENLTLRCIDLQGQFQDVQAELSKVRDTIRAVRNRSTYDFVSFKKAQATRLAEHALAGTVANPTDLPDVIGVAETQTQIELTLSGLDQKVRETERKLAAIRSAHRLTVIELARRHADTAGAKFVEARDNFVRECASLVALDASLTQSGLPAPSVLNLSHDLEVPLTRAEFTARPMSGWTHRLSFEMDKHLKPMGNSYRAALADIGVVMNLEG
jgi:hypothetical protein